MIDKSLNNDSIPLQKNDIAEQLNSTKKSLESNLCILFSTTENFRPQYFEGNIGQCFDITREVGTAVLGLLEEVEQSKKLILLLKKGDGKVIENQQDGKIFLQKENILVIKHKNRIFLIKNADDLVASSKK